MSAARKAGLFVFLVLFTLPLAAQQQVTAGSADGDPGDSVEVPLTFTGDGTAAVFQVDVTYDPNVLDVSAMDGAALGVHVLSSATPSPGILRLVLYSANNAVLMNGELARLAVSVDSLAPGGVDQPLGLEAAVAGDAVATALPVALTAGNVEVGTGPLPRVSGVTTVPSSDRFGFTQVAVRFSETLRDPVGDDGADDVTNPDNFLLVTPGADGVVDTTGCAAGAAPQDVTVPVDAVTYDAATDTATLRVNGKVPVASGSYRLFSCRTLADLNKNALDGNADGTAGDDHVRGLRSEMTNLLRNPNFDDDLAFWTTASPSQAEILHHGDDAEGAATSGSAQVMNLSGAGQVFALAQCVELDGSPAYWAGGRIRVMSGRPTDPVDFVTVDYFDAPGCGGTLVDTSTSNVVLGDTAEVWSGALASVVVAPSNGVSALVAFVIEAGASPDFVGHFDSVFFAGKLDVFSDGFESGDVTRWSSASR